MIPTCSGLRSPGGIGFNEKGEVFFAENQGPWNGACALRHLEPGSFQGHPIGNKWYDLAPNMGPKPEEPKSGSRIYVEAARIPELLSPRHYPAVQQGRKQPKQHRLRYERRQIRPLQPCRFSPATSSHSNIARYVLQKVKGKYQGVCIPFRQGFASGVLPDPSRRRRLDDRRRLQPRVGIEAGPKPFSLEHLVWTGKVPFEFQNMELTPDGFDLTFTDPVDTASASNVDTYKMSTWRYIYQASYGSPEVDTQTRRRSNPRR
jgi:hypothetical protein